MQWIHHYQLFLFDFDGLLVNTEFLHFQAYMRMCAKRNFLLNWSFERYSQIAHHSATGLSEQIYSYFPALYAQESRWEVLYEEKKQAFLELIQEGSVQLMPGAQELLAQIKQAHIPCCVVTHSPLSLIQSIRKQLPVLNDIPYWITRENYSQPKPHSECYQLAIKQLAKIGDRIIGFEDSPRGLKALLGTEATPLLVCPPTYAYVKEERPKHVKYYSSLAAITDANPP